MSRKSGLNKPTMRPIGEGRLTGAQRRKQAKEWCPVGKTNYGVKHTGGRGKVRAS